MTSLTDLDLVHHWCDVVAQAAASKKGEDIIILDVGPVLAITDCFVITSAPNDRLVRAIAEEIERALKEAGGPARVRTEGIREGEWVLLDYGDFVVHVFLEETRRFYDLEGRLGATPSGAVGRCQQGGGARRVGGGPAGAPGRGRSVRHGLDLADPSGRWLSLASTITPAPPISSRHGQLQFSVTCRSSAVAACWYTWVTSPLG